MTSLGEALVAELARRGVDTIFGIPGVHTVELYRGLAAAGIRHVTPRHEQGAGFMADGYARATGRPGLALVITGPGVTNTLTALGQARADSVPLLLLSGVNALPGLGQGLGYLHELPDQRGLTALITRHAERVTTGSGLVPALDRAFAACLEGRPGPVHLEIPLDVAGLPLATEPLLEPQATEPLPKPLLKLGSSPRTPPDPAQISAAVRLLQRAERPVILAGGGVRHAATALKQLAEALDAPVVQTVNARGLMHAHPLSVPASPSLHAVRDLIGEADGVLALGTELGPTDYDMYATGTMPRMENLIRVDICAEQLQRRPLDLAIEADAAAALNLMLAELRSGQDSGQDSALPSAPDPASPETAQATPTRTGAARAAATREAALEEIGPDMRDLTLLLEALRDRVPQAFMVGDSAQPIYAGNLYYDHDRPGGWFNAATGFGALGYAIPAAIGVAVAEPKANVICLTGDGGAQFTLPELMTARDENLPITFIIWNNRGYQEIETSMEAVGVTPVGCDPTPPDFEAVAQACALPFFRCRPSRAALVAAIDSARQAAGPSIIEIEAT